VPTDVDAWDGPCGRLAARALDLAAGCDDATKCARLLVESADAARWGGDRIDKLTAVRWRLAGQLDHDPGDLVALTALGLVGLAGMEPTTT
jgi:hypothetical protein